MNTDTAAAATISLARLALDRQELEHDVYGAVLDARLAGLSWSAIGRALEVTAQAAHLRYHGRSCNRAACQEEGHTAD